MKPVVFVFSHDNIFSGVKQEASLLSVRMKDDKDNPLFDELVFDEAYLTKFRELFFDAQAGMDLVLSKFMKGVPVGMGCLETKDFSKDRDYEVFLAPPAHWNFHLQKPLDIKIKEYLIAYILWRWLETKDLSLAIVYRQRCDSVVDEIRRMMNVFVRGVEREHYWWG